MKRKNFTGFLLEGKRGTFLTVSGVLILVAVIFIGCYQFRSINQPSTAYANSYFDVPIVCERDDDPGLTEDDWANTLRNIGLFGVMIPNGWSVKDSIPYTIISKNAALNNSGFLVYNAAHTQTLQDSIPAFSGYHWWGAITDRTAELTSLDSFYFTPRIFTNNQLGTFNLRYAVGDKDYWDRNPADQYNYGGGLSDPMPITITLNTGLDRLFDKSNVKIFYNAESGTLHVELATYGSEVISMRVLNMSGSVVHTNQVLSRTCTFTVPNLASGVYIVELKNGTHISRTKILVR